jgi:hypothetical protein
VANVIEILLRTIGADKATKDVKGLGSAIGLIKKTVAGVAAGLTVGAIIGNIEEAESVASKLDHAYSKVNVTVGVTRKRMDDLASELQATTTVSDDLVKSAESLLTTFTLIRGSVFERTIRVANDLTTQLGTDLTGAVRQLGIALSDPEQGLTRLRRAGVLFTEGEQKIIKGLVESGQLMKAQEKILASLESRFAGAGAAARNTLGGALSGLKNAFGDLFEGTAESTNEVTGAINELSKALSDPKIKEGIDTLLVGAAKLGTLTTKSIGGLAAIKKELQEFAKSDSVIAKFLSTSPLLLAIRGELAVGGDESRKRGGKPVGSSQSGHSAVDFAAGLQKIEDPVNEVRVSLQRLTDDVPAFLQDMNSATKTEVETAVTHFAQMKAQINALLNEGIIDKDTAAKRREEALDNLLPEFDLDDIRKLYKPVERATDSTADYIRGVWQGVGQSIQSSLADAVYGAKISMRSLVDIVKRAIAEIIAAKIISGIGKIILGSGKGGGGGGSGGGLAEFFAGLFGSKAGGGRTGNLELVGEEGPELLARPGSRVYNSRQLAFAMSGNGGGVTFSPSYNVSIVADDSDKREARMLEFFQATRKRDQEEFVRRMARNGYTLR